MKTLTIHRTGLAAAFVAAVAITLEAQAPGAPPRQGAALATQPPAATAGASAAPADYVIGPDDVLVVMFWRDKDMSSEVIVRPDGKITLPLLNEMEAAGLTPEELRAKIVEAARKFVQDEPTVNVVVKQINSRKVFITGNVAKPGPYPLMEPTTVLQLISKAGGLVEYADRKHIVIIRGSEKRPDGQPVSYLFNYEQVTKRQNLRQNILLKPGDQVIVP